MSRSIVNFYSTKSLNIYTNVIIGDPTERNMFCSNIMQNYGNVSDVYRTKLAAYLNAKCWFFFSKQKNDKNKYGAILSHVLG